VYCSQDCHTAGPIISAVATEPGTTVVVVATVAVAATMDHELVADCNQFDHDDGSLSCTAAAVCCARLFLDKGGATFTKDDLHRALAAGAAVYRTWRRDAPPATPTLQCWTDVVRIFPTVLEGYTATYETNGFFASPDPSTAAFGGYTSFTRALDALARSAPRRSAGVLTARQGSYAVAYDAPHWYVFDPHGTVDGGSSPTSPSPPPPLTGSPPTSPPPSPPPPPPPSRAPATMRRTAHRTTFETYVRDDVVRGGATTEFQLVVFGVPPTPP